MTKKFDPFTGRNLVIVLLLTKIYSKYVDNLFPSTIPWDQQEIGNPMELYLFPVPWTVAVDGPMNTEPLKL